MLLLLLLLIASLAWSQEGTRGGADALAAKAAKALEINNNNGKTLPAGANPACSIGAVRVTDAAGMTVLNGSF